MKKRIFGCFLVIYLAFTIIANAATVRVSWNSNSEQDLGGYILYYGTNGISYYPNNIDVGNVTFYDIDVEENTTYHFALTAYDTVTNESGFSKEKSVCILANGNGGIILLGVAGTADYNNSIMVADVSGNTPRQNYVRLGLPNLTKGQVVRFQGNVFFENGVNQNGQTCIPFIIKSSTTGEFFAYERDILADFDVTDFNIPIVINKTLDNYCADVDLGLWPGHSQVQITGISIEGNHEVVTDFYPRRFLAATSNTITVELAWEAVPDIDYYQIWGSPAPNSYNYQPGMTFDFSVPSSATSTSVNIPLNNGMHFCIAPVVAGVMQPANTFFLLPGNVVGQAIDNLMNAELRNDNIDKTWLTSHLNQLVVPINGWADKNCFTDNNGSGIITLIDLTKISFQIVNNPFPSLGRR